MGKQDSQVRGRRLSCYYQPEAGRPSELPCAAPGGVATALDKALPMVGRNVPRALGHAGYVFYIRTVLPEALDMPSLLDSLLAVTGILLAQQGVSLVGQRASHARLARSLWTLCLLSVFRPCFKPDSAVSALLEPSCSEGLAASPGWNPGRATPQPVRKRKGSREPVHLAQTWKRSALLAAGRQAAAGHEAPGREALSPSAGAPASSASSMSSHVIPGNSAAKAAPVARAVSLKEPAGRFEELDCSRFDRATAGNRSAVALSPKPAAAGKNGKNEAKGGNPRDPRLHAPSARPAEKDEQRPCGRCDALRRTVEDLRAEAGLYAQRLDALQREQVRRWLSRVRMP